MAQVAFINGETLFMHGGITKDNLGYIPFSKARKTNIPNWLAELNYWYKSEFDKWAQRPTWNYELVSIFSISTQQKLGWQFLKVPKFDGSIHGVPHYDDYELPSKWSARSAHRLLDYALPTPPVSVINVDMFDKAKNCQYGI